MSLVNKAIFSARKYFEPKILGREGRPEYPTIEQTGRFKDPLEITCILLIHLDVVVLIIIVLMEGLG